MVAEMGSLSRPFPQPGLSPFHAALPLLPQPSAGSEPPDTSQVLEEEGDLSGNGGPPKWAEHSPSHLTSQA